MRFSDWYRAIAPLGDGSVLTGGFRVGLLGASGRQWLTTSPNCCGLWSAFDGAAGPLASVRWVQPLDLAVDADGGWLVPEPGRLLYVAPPAPRRLAVGLARPTVSSRLPVTATVETTRPARITVTVRIHGRQVGMTTVDRPAGRWRIPVPGGRPAVLNVISVLAADADGQVATDRIGVIPGATLP